MSTNRPDWTDLWLDLQNPAQIWGFQPADPKKPEPRPEKIVLMLQQTLEPLVILRFPKGTTEMLRRAARRAEIIIYEHDYYTPTLLNRRMVIRSDFLYRKMVEHPFLFTADRFGPSVDAGDAGTFWDQAADDITSAFRATVPYERQEAIERMLGANPADMPAGCYKDWVEPYPAPRHGIPRNGLMGMTKAVTRTYQEMLRQEGERHVAASVTVPPWSPPPSAVPTPSPPKYIRVLYNGVPWSGVVNAKEGAEGWIDARILDEEGNPVLKNGYPAVERLEGRVEIIPERP